MHASAMGIQLSKLRTWPDGPPLLSTPLITAWACLVWGLPWPSPPPRGTAWCQLIRSLRREDDLMRYD
jgi:hypothetical protein